MMTPVLRPYQRKAIDDLWQWMRKNKGNPLLVLPTGAGKSVVQSSLIHEALQMKPSARILCVSHVKEIIQQNATALHKFFPSIQCGICCAGLGRKELDRKVTFASVQTLHARLKKIPQQDLVIIDEAHLVPHGTEGRYRDLIGGIGAARVVGLTATPYRLSGGWLHEGRDALFDGIAVDVSPLDLTPTYLSPLTNRSGLAVDYSRARIRGGEFVDLDIAQIALDVVKSAAEDLLRRAEGRKKVLVFACGIEHADRLAEFLPESATVHSKMAGNRSDTLKRFRNGSVRFLVNVDVLTTGFDYPGIDCIALMRPTMSAGLYVQMLGRGMRKAEGKANCLILDYGGNIERHGTLDSLSVETTSKSAKLARECEQCGELFSKSKDKCPGCGSVETKECPACKGLVRKSATSCPDCLEFFGAPRKPNHSATAYDTGRDVFSVDDRWEPVVTVEFSKHQKVGGKHPTMRVRYRLGRVLEVSEFVCFEHEGFARRKAEQWSRSHGVADVPATVDDALRIMDSFAVPSVVKIELDGKYWRVAGKKWRAQPTGEKTEPAEPLGPLNKQSALTENGDTKR